MNCDYRVRVIRDFDEPATPEAHVQADGGKVVVSLYRDRRKVRDAKFGATGTRWLVAFLVLAAEQAERQGLAAAKDCDSDAKGGLA